jgi:hypothetical protein
MMTTTPNRLLLVAAFATLVTACAGGSRSGGTVGPAGGTVTSASGVALVVPAGALSTSVDLHIVEVEPGNGAMARIELEPRGTKLAAPAKLSFKLDDGNVVVSEVEHAASGEVKHGLSKQRHASSASGQVEVEVEVTELGEVEVEHGATCDVACDTGTACDDGVCTAEDVADDHGTDPAAPGAPDDHGVDPATPATPATPADPNAPAPAPVDDSGTHAPGHV